MSQSSGANLLIRSITPAGGTPLDVGTINVLVGGNNVGKSEALRDMVRLAGNFDPASSQRAAGEEPSTRVIQDVAFVPKLTLERLVRGIQVEGASEGTVVAGLGPDLRTPYRRAVPVELKSVLFRPMITARSVWTTSLGEIMPLRVAYLAPEKRTQWVEPVAAASPVQTPENLLQAFHAMAGEIAEPFDAAMTELLDGRHVVLDATERINLCLRVSPTIPPLTGNPVHDVHLYRALPRLDEQGDGWKSCAAVVLAFLTCPGRIVLIDQPEAHLHPRQAWQLGAWIAEQAPRLGAQVFVATRDTSFLSGLFSGATDVSIFRMSRVEQTTRVELIPPDVGKALALFPLFAAQNALRCLFDEGVVLAPEESDRVIYQTVAERFLRVRNVAFLHAHGARNLALIARLLRRAHLPTCVIAELDVFQGEQTLVELVKALSQADPPAPWLATRDRLISHVEGWFDEDELSSSASEVESFLDELKKGGASGTGIQTTRAGQHSSASKWDRLRRERLGVFPPELRVWVEELLEDLKRIGLLVSPKGQLQGWMDPGVDQRESWFNRAVQALDRGECPADLRGFVAEAAAFVRAAR
jgi:hypothetical protein